MMTEVGQPKAYKRPPIVEALIDLQFETRLSEKELSALKEKFGATYSALFDTKNVEVTINPGGTISTRDEPAGFKANSNDGTDIAVITRQGLSTSRLAPYQGWEALEKLARANYMVFRDVVGHRQVKRIGVRYINRIDYPVHDLLDTPMGMILRIHPMVPKELNPTPNAFGTRYEYFDQENQLTVILNSASLEPALIDHISLLLDIDVIRAGVEGIPQKPDDLWALINHLRIQKNRVFEVCITDVLREQFDK